MFADLPLLATSHNQADRITLNMDFYMLQTISVKMFTLLLAQHIKKGLAVTLCSSADPTPVKTSARIWVGIFRAAMTLPGCVNIRWSHNVF